MKSLHTRTVRISKALRLLRQKVGEALRKAYNLAAEVVGIKNLMAESHLGKNTVTMENPLSSRGLGYPLFQQAMAQYQWLWWFWVLFGQA